MWDLCSLDWKLLFAAAVVFAEGECFGGEGTTKSSSCPPACQKLQACFSDVPIPSNCQWHLLHPACVVVLCTSMHTKK